MAPRFVQASARSRYGAAGTDHVVNNEDRRIFRLSRKYLAQTTPRLRRFSMKPNPAGLPERRHTPPSEFCAPFDTTPIRGENRDRPGFSFLSNHVGEQRHRAQMNSAAF